MKGQVWRRLRQAPVLRWSDILFTLVPALAWAALVHARPVFMQLRCAEKPDSCTAANVLFLDRVALGKYSERADHFSFITQDTSGYLAFGGALAWDVTLGVLGRLTPLGALAAVGTDWVIIFQSAAWNGMANECARLLVQRPRPFVYENPKVLGADAANYTSFYSGHTSFSAAAGVALLLTLLARGLPNVALGFMASGVSLLIGLTGLFRVLAGRHFVTDVLMGALAGTLVACAVAYFHRNGARAKR
jgi:membrane-associated phospholipid phosphatase